MYIAIQSRVCDHRGLKANANAIVYRSIYVALYMYPRRGGGGGGGWGNKVHMLIHTYPHESLRKIKWPYAITRLTAHFMYGLQLESGLVILQA